MTKRKANIIDELDDNNIKKYKEMNDIKKHSLDSDEEDDNQDAYNIMNENDIEGEEEGVAGHEDGIRITAFNMRDEMEEGHFDSDGHFIWKKDNDIRDNWLDNIDWQQIQPKHMPNSLLESNSDSEPDEHSENNEIQMYQEILKYMERKETVGKALRRLGGTGKKLSTVERLKLKKSGGLVQSDKVIKFTELVNNLLNKTGNMDIYEETYETISAKVCGANKSQEQELDMYADDFGEKEKQRLDEPGTAAGPGPSNVTQTGISQTMWEFKWKLDATEIEGPNTTQQMQKWVDEGRFKEGVWVRKCGQEQFYSSSRIDFELYLS